MSKSSRLGLSSNTINTTTSLNVTCIEKERESLLLFKQNLTGRSNLLSTWIGVECCEWHGIGCDSENGHVVKLDLRPRDPYNVVETLLLNDKLLEGELSPALQNLKYLRYMDLSMNHFSGKIPEFLGSFEYLEYLNLSASGFYGVVPHHLGNLSRLRYLDLRHIFLVDDHHTSPSYLSVISAPGVDDLG
ncbi:putative histone deacetylase [Helianthus annuus]|uniref:Histone deacetylase n=1 Tax=Helianthus annuus TaxID=4232 RepID=A0A9K3GVL1_HELAN|nr:putative histone deacetylase [Helianthus annuus]KAJ0430847.1 putative histone deacetylase [Helianthus annuus]KAJ0435888.1 putative histone deacetylase [Helianthus annuus]KAJ0637951.1 putative histone deacetylase [Helianthus annuus]KAJ0815132.1 putative histone deacetylase [Helianthus annuus]